MTGVFGPLEVLEDTKIETQLSFYISNGWTELFICQ